MYISLIYRVFFFNKKNKMPRQRVLSSKLNHFRLPIILHEKQANKKQNIKLGGILTSSSLDTNSLHIRYKRLYSRPLCER